MKKPFKEHHLISLLKSFDNSKLPADLFISNYFKQNRALGSKDRAYIAETVYRLIRWQLLIDYLVDDPKNLEQKIEFLENFNWQDYQSREDIPAHIRVSFPKELYDLLVKHYGTLQANELAIISNHPAPTMVRANLLKTSRDALLKEWEKLYEVVPAKYSAEGIQFLKKINFFTTPEFKEGKFEVQDEGSQILASYVDLNPGELVLDYCAGSGGKTLAFAPRLQNTGQMYLHDIRHYALLEAKKRLKRAGIQNAQIIEANSPNLKKLKKKMDWVLVDAPCSGTGTLRRNPDMKWKFDEAMVKRLVGEQRNIFEKALSFMKPNGKIVYATCSLLPEENEEQLEFFQKVHKLQIDGEPFKSLPSMNGMDGFFAVVLKHSV